MELLIVVAILGLLTAAAAPVYQNARSRAQRVALAADMGQMYSALVRYHADHGQFPSDVGADAFDLSTLAPLTTEGYLASAEAFKAKLANNRILFYWAPDWDGPNNDVVVIARSAVDPNVLVYVFHYDIAGWFGYDGVYFVEDGRYVRADGSH